MFKTAHGGFTKDKTPKANVTFDTNDTTLPQLYSHGMSPKIQMPQEVFFSRNVGQIGMNEVQFFTTKDTTNI